MSKLNKFELPKIPGRIYKAKFLNKYRVFIIYPFLALLFVYFDLLRNISHVKVVFIYIIFTMGVLFELIERFSDRWVEYVYVSETYLDLKFGNGKRVRDDLSNYRLVVGENTITHPDEKARTYSYGVYLLRKDCPVQIYITLKRRIFFPKQLKEWVESFQSQIVKPLSIVFSSPEIESDYNTGVYMC